MHDQIPNNLGDLRLFKCPRIKGGKKIKKYIDESVRRKDEKFK